MHAFRFATSVLVGPWRPSRDEALSDAVQAGQAVRDRNRPDGLEWRVDGRIEEVRRSAASPGPVCALAR